MINKQTNLAEKVVNEIWIYVGSGRQDKYYRNNNQLASADAKGSHAISRRHQIVESIITAVSVQIEQTEV